MIAEAALDELRDRNPVAEVAIAAGARLRRSGKSLIGSCPLCSARASGSATRFEVKADGRAWVCAVCADGGDVIRLVERLRACSFRQAVDYLGGAREIDPAEAARRQAEKAAKAAADEDKRARYREAERRRLRGIWDRGEPIAGSLVETYLRARGLVVPVTNALRFLPRAEYFHGNVTNADGQQRPRLVHVGPAMIAAIEAEKFSGLHFTYLAPDGSGKAQLVDPDSGAALPSKKVRGTKTAAAIKLIRGPRERLVDADGVVTYGPATPPRLIWGEGIETVLSVAQSAVARPDDAFWCAIDLGNIGGRSAKTVAHPTEKTDNGRAKRVAGPEPDLEQPSVAIPDSVGELVILGDGDSDRFETDNAARRCNARYGRPGRVVRLVWARKGADFNDMKRAAL